MSMRYKLNFVANYKNEKKGHRITNVVLDAVVKDNISTLLCEIQDLRESLKTAVKNL
jgi:hypothetical protein